MFMNNDFGFVFLLTQFFFLIISISYCVISFYIAEKYCICIAPFHRVWECANKTVIYRKWFPLKVLFKDFADSLGRLHISKNYVLRQVLFNEFCLVVRRKCFSNSNDNLPAGFFQGYKKCNPFSTWCFAFNWLTF